MNVYTGNIITGILIFPLIAFIITLPYMIYQYRKIGSIPWFRTLVVYSFVFYLLVAYFMVILPLPEDRSAVVPYAATPQLVPFNFLTEFLAETTFRISDPSTWLGTLRDSYVYEAIFNVLLLVPLGMYLRYYFRRTWWQTLLIGFGMTLFYETSQLTGLWGIYAHPYRLFDVDDLMLNTLGAMVGFWLVGPMMRVLPDIRLVNEEAREAGLRASVTRRALSFVVDLVLASVLTSLLVFVLSLVGIQADAASQASGWSYLSQTVSLLSFLCCFVLAPSLLHGQTIGQKLLRLRIVRPDASPARWYQYLTRYGLLFLFAIIPFLALSEIVSLNPENVSEMGAIAGFVAKRQAAFVVAWLILMSVWGLSLVVRAFHSARKKTPFVMLNGLLSNTRVMTVNGVERERERRRILSVQEVSDLEQLIAQQGTPLAELMEKAGHAVADTVCTWMPDPAPVLILTGAGNNGGDGWVAAQTLAEKGYPVTLIAPDIAERLRAEPARTTAQEVFADANERALPLRVLIAPDVDILADAMDKTKVVIDAVLGTGFNDDEVREPYASWIQSANRRRFEGARGKGRGQHRKRTHERGAHERGKKRLINKVKDAPLCIAVDVPSGLSAQTGTTAHPCLAADITVTFLAFKPGLVAQGAPRWTGHIKLAKLVDTKPFLNSLDTD